MDGEYEISGQIHLGSLSLKQCNSYIFGSLKVFLKITFSEQIYLLYFLVYT